jgi:hypothetical protein
MKAVKLSLVIMAAALLTIGLGGMVYAFHDGGVAYCEGCHTMHNSLGGSTMYKSTTKGSVPKGSVGTANAYLLQGSDQSSTCLMCHAAQDTVPSSYHVMTMPVPAVGTAPSEMTPGGDFAYLLKKYTYGSNTSDGQTHGHNIIAFDFGLVTGDTRFPKGAPGGNYPTNSLGCNSCHDPHSKYRMDNTGALVVPSIGGKAVPPINGSGSTGTLPPDTTYAVGVYRLLGGVGYLPKSAGSANIFTANPPIAVSPPVGGYNRKETSTDTRVAYGSGMSEWCSNCHGTTFHGQASGSSGSELKHPSGSTAKFTADIVTNYKNYVKSGDLSGTFTTTPGPYTSLVPFEEGTTDIPTLKGHAFTDGTQKGGPDKSSQVMCLSCHRAHASAWDSATRWNVRATYLTLSGNYPTDGSNEAQGRTQAEWRAAMYDRPPTYYATFQRSLCNKCHAKD